MWQTLSEIFSYSFMIRAFVAGIIVAISAPLIGNFLVMRRFSLVADTLSHIALVGVAIGFLTGTQPLVVTVLVTVTAAIVIENLRTTKKISGESLLAIFLPGGLALAVVLVSRANALNGNFLGYLFGSITTVKADEIWLIIGLGAITVLTTWWWRRELLFAAFDEDLARLNGIHVKRINTLLMVLTALTIAISMRIVGVLLIGALMVIPVVAATQIARSFKQTLWLSVLVAEIAVVIGLVVAYLYNLPAGGAIVLTALGLFGVATVWGRRDA